VRRRRRPHRHRLPVRPTPLSFSHRHRPARRCVAWLGRQFEGGALIDTRSATPSIFAPLASEAQALHVAPDEASAPPPMAAVEDARLLDARLQDANGACGGGGAAGRLLPWRLPP